MKSLSKIKGANLHTNFFKRKSTLYYLSIICIISLKEDNYLKTNMLNLLDSDFDFRKLELQF